MDSSLLIHLSDVITWQKKLNIHDLFLSIAGRSLLERTVDRVVGDGYQELILVGNSTVINEALLHLDHGRPWGVLIRRNHQRECVVEMDHIRPHWQRPKCLLDDLKDILCDGGIHHDLLPSWADTPGVWVNRGVKVHPGAKLIPPIFLGEGVIVEDGVVCGPFVDVERESILSSGVEASHSYIGSEILVAPDIHLNHMLVMKDSLCQVERESFISASRDISRRRS